jgi:1,6-anhydro-N-acetylmuramate kinase
MAAPSSPAAPIPAIGLMSGTSQDRVDVARLATSKTCSHCGFRCEEMPLDVRNGTCPNCGSAHDRDVNAASNVKHFGIL